MSLITIIPDEEASEEGSVIFRHSKQMFGRVANAVRVASHSPKIAQSLFSFIVSGLREEISEILDKYSLSPSSEKFFIVSFALSV